MTDLNRICYQNNKVVDIYLNANYLDKPEVMLLYKFEEKLRFMRMLDIGVGCGRTTYYFGHRVNHYTGIDYSEKMIKLSQKRFPDLEFFQCDVRNLERFEDNSFDLVLFSFNGIDSISHEDRLRAFQEIRRVCRKPGGFFFFSSHNLNFVPYWFSFKYSLDPFVTCSNLYKYLLLKLKNRNINCEKGYAIINDGAHNFKLKQYYISPDEQIKQLKNAGFTNIHVFRFDSGTEISETDEIKNDPDPWVHYLCES